jgi:HD-GYP domain-containing protein (c-di-GMP phosphodiesterase class II)
MSKPLRAAPLLRAVERAVEFKRLSDENRLYQQHLEQLVAERTAELEAMMEGTIKAMGRALESRDPYTAGHQRRVALLGRAIAWEMGLSDAVARAVYFAGLLHDLGKISVPSDLLTRPGQLTDYEFVLIQQHPRVGHDILAQVPFELPLAEIVHQHHERLDGAGYPRGLRDEFIMPEARILAVADVVEAISNHRPYRPARGLEHAMYTIDKHRESDLDPEVVRACVRLFKERGFTLE